MLFIRTLKALEIVVEDFRMPTNKNSVPQLSGCGMTCTD